MEEIEMASHVQFDDAAIRPISSIKRDVTAAAPPPATPQYRIEALSGIPVNGRGIRLVKSALNRARSLASQVGGRVMPTRAQGWPSPRPFPRRRSRST